MNKIYHLTNELNYKKILSKGVNKNSSWFIDEFLCKDWKNYFVAKGIKSINTVKGCVIAMIFKRQAFS